MMLRCTGLIICWVMCGASLSSLDIAAARKDCEASRTADANYEELIRTFAFEQAIAYCDAHADEKCRAVSRQWLATQEFTGRNYPRAEQLFAEAKSIAVEGQQVLWHYTPTSGWTTPGDIESIMQQHKTLPAIPPEYSQKVLLLFTEGTDAMWNNTRVKESLDVCSIVHAHLSMNLIARYVEVFSQGKYSLSVVAERAPVTVKKFSKGTHADTDSLEPWSVDFLLTIARYYREYDSMFYIYPNARGGIATGGTGYYPILPPVAYGTSRSGVIIPTGWTTLRNFPQVFHEYTHTVESSVQGVKATSHGEGETKMLRKLTGLPASGEADWLAWHWINTIQPKIDKWATEKARTGYGYLDYFGFASYYPYTISDRQLRALHKLKSQLGSAHILMRKESAKKKNAAAYEFFNKKSNAKAAAQSSLESAELFPWEGGYLSNAEWFIDHSGMSDDEKKAMKTKLDALR